MQEKSAFRTPETHTILFQSSWRELSSVFLTTEIVDSPTTGIGVGQLKAV